MIDVRAESIIYQSQIYYRDLLNDLVVKKRLGKALLDKWAKADLILGYLEALNYRTLLTNEEDILNVNYILECLIKLCELNQYPVAAPLTFQEAPAIIVGQPGATGATGATGPRGFTGLATDFSVISTSVTTVVDSFPITSAKAARWDYHVINTANAQRAASVIGHWTPDGALTDLVDSGADDLVGDTSGLEFNIVYTPTNIQLVAVITSGTWSITGSRYFIPNNGNGSGPITNVLPLGRIYIGNASNQAQDFTVTGDVLLSTSGVTTIQPNVIVDSQINSSANITLSKLASLNNNIVPITNGSGKLISSTLNPTTLGFVDIGSSLTGLLGAKLTDPMTSIGDIVIRNASNITTRLAAGTNNQVLTIVAGVPTWQNAPGGVSGLTTNFLPKATSSTTLGNSIISESTGAINIAGTLDAQGGMRTNGGAYLLTKIVQIGDWDMPALSTKFVAHGLGSNYQKIRNVSVMIISDTDVGSYLVPLPTAFSNFPTSASGVNTINNTNISLTRETLFVSTDFNQTSYNRGWVTITYEA